MSRKVKSMYLLIHTPVHVGRPLQVGFVPKATWSTKLFDEYQKNAELNRVAGGSRLHLRKREIEQWGFMPPCGARFEVIEVEVPMPVEPEMK